MTTATPSKPKHAVILSGGGANGAYEIGVLKALVAGKSPTTNFEPLDPEIITGTSVGAYNAAFLTSQWEEYGTAAVANLEQIWLYDISESWRHCGNGAFRIRGNPLPLFNPFCYIPDPLKPWGQLFEDGRTLAWDGLQRLVSLVSETETPVLERLVNLIRFSSFVSTSPLVDLIHETIRFDSLRRSDRLMRIAATNWALGEVEVFSKADMTDRLGPQIISASAAIPGVFPPQKVGAQPYVDGGVLLNSPLQPAIDAGADILHVISLNPEVKKIPLSHMDNTLASAWRVQVIAWVHAVEQSMLKIWALNRTIEVVNRAQRAIQRLQGATPVGYEDDASGDRSLFELQEIVKNYRPITVYRYFPRDDLGGPLGLLNFDQQRLQHLIERGFSDAITYSLSDVSYVPPWPLEYLFNRSQVAPPAAD